MRGSARWRHWVRNVGIWVSRLALAGATIDTEASSWTSISSRVRESEVNWHFGRVYPDNQ